MEAGLELAAREADLILGVVLGPRSVRASLVLEVYWGRPGSWGCRCKPGAGVHGEVGCLLHSPSPGWRVSPCVLCYSGLRLG